MSENSASAHFSDEEEKADDEHIKTEDTQKKRKVRTKEDIEKEVLSQGDLYGLLDLADKTYEAGQRDIEKAYKKLALIYHPDKLGSDYEGKDKEMWLSV